jgi:hypothetical protein
MRSKNAMRAGSSGSRWACVPMQSTKSTCASVPSVSNAPVRTAKWPRKSEQSSSLSGPKSMPTHETSPSFLFKGAVTQQGARRYGSLNGHLNSLNPIFKSSHAQGNYDTTTYPNRPCLDAFHCLGRISRGLVCHLPHPHRCPHYLQCGWV